MKSKNASWIASAAIIVLLVVAGPAQAFNLFLDVNNKSPIRGETITFTAEVNIQQGERLPVDYLTLVLTGTENQLCEFYPSGEIKSGCKGVVNIVKINSPDYSYGYGYGYYGYGYDFGYGYGYGSQNSGKLTYKITLDTSQLPVGSFSTNLKVKIGSKEFSQAGPDFSISQLEPARGRRNNPIQTECTTSWVCSEFGPCDNGYQYRSCVLENPQCESFPDTPALTRTCSMRPLSTPIDEIPFPQEQQTQEETSPSEGLSRITGAVIGPFGATLADLFLVVAGMVIVIGGLSTILIIRRLSLKRKFAYYTGEFS